MSGNWRDRAECRAYVEAEMERGELESQACEPWHTIHSSYNDADSQKAKRICNGTLKRKACPVKAECLDYAMRHGIKHGIWGGLDPDERDLVARRQRRLKAAS